MVVPCVDHFEPTKTCEGLCTVKVSETASYRRARNVMIILMMLFLISSFFLVSCKSYIHDHDIARIPKRCSFSDFGSAQFPASSGRLEVIEAWYHNDPFEHTKCSLSIHPVMTDHHIMAPLAAPSA